MIDDELAYHRYKLSVSFLISTNRPETIKGEYCRGAFLLPQREEGWKWENGILPTWARQRILSTWGIQIGPFAAICTNYISQILQLFHFHAGRPILITPERGGLEMGKWISPNLGQAGDIECLGHSNWTICSHLLISDFQNLTTCRLG